MFFTALSGAPGARRAVALAASVVLLALLPTGCAEAPRAAVTPPDGPVSVEFVMPERFTDARWRTTGRGADSAVLDALREQLASLAPGCLPDGRRLAIRITDVDLAGDAPLGADSEPRMMRAITWPRVELDWRLSDTAGALLDERSERLTDMDYLNNAEARRDRGPLRYDRALLTDWFRRRFCG